MLRPICRLVLVLVVLLSVAAGLRAADEAPREKAPPKKDPVESAFALPRGMVLTPEETKWANAKRAELEPKLRAALSRVENATEEKEKLEAANQVRQVKEEIEAAINTILQQRAKKAGEQYAKKMAQAKKKAAEAAKKRAKNKKKGGNKKGKRR